MTDRQTSTQGVQCEEEYPVFPNLVIDPGTVETGSIAYLTEHSIAYYGLGDAKPGAYPARIRVSWASSKLTITSLGEEGQDLATGIYMPYAQSQPFLPGVRLAFYAYCVNPDFQKSKNPVRRIVALAATEQGRLAFFREIDFLGAPLPDPGSLSFRLFATSFRCSNGYSGEEGETIPGPPVCWELVQDGFPPA